jgi:hypothetical protein
VLERVFLELATVFLDVLFGRGGDARGSGWCRFGDRLGGVGTAVAGKSWQQPVL